MLTTTIDRAAQHYILAEETTMPRLTPPAGDPRTAEEYT
jgi:hypothetical protein